MQAACGKNTAPGTTRETARNRSPWPGKGTGGRRVSPGFTLLELLVALAVGSLVVTATYAVFHACTGAERRGTLAMTEIRLARYAFDALTRDAGSLPPRVRTQDVDCAGRSCLFPILASNGTEVWVSYQLTDQGGLEREIFARKPGDQGDAAPFQRTSLCQGLGDGAFRTDFPADPGISAKPWPRSLGLDLLFSNGRDQGARYGCTVLLEMEPSRG